MAVVTAPIEAIAESAPDASAKEDFCNDERYNFKCKKACGICDD